jgi:hypothetical protein
VEEVGERPRALSRTQARECGLIPREYSYKDLPSEFIALLQFKVWGKSKNLNLYFKCEDGSHYVVSVAARDDYSPKNMPNLDLSSREIQPGVRFQITTSTSPRGNTSFLEARILK